MVGHSVRNAVKSAIKPYEKSRLRALLNEVGPYAIKFVQSRWATEYLKAGPLKVSHSPALTWGTATYVTPIAFPLSSALYGRVGLVTEFDPTDWSIFDATDPAAQVAYVRWVQSQPAFSDLVLTVHSTYANHYLRNKFRTDFRIDCVLFHPDQEAEIHTDRDVHTWMAVTDWNTRDEIDASMSQRLSKARFTVLIDEDFDLEENGLPVRRAARQVERATETIRTHQCVEVAHARSDPNLPKEVVRYYHQHGYIHVYIRP